MNNPLGRGGLPNGLFDADYIHSDVNVKIRSFMMLGSPEQV